MVSVAKGFPTLHGKSEFSMKTFDDVDGLFSVYSKGNKKTKKRFKIPGKFKPEVRFPIFFEILWLRCLCSAVFGDSDVSEIVMLTT